MTIRPEIALTVAMQKLDAAVRHMEEAARYAAGFDERMRVLAAEIKLLRQEVEARWRDALRAAGAPT